MHMKIKKALKVALVCFTVFTICTCMQTAMGLDKQSKTREQRKQDRRHHNNFEWYAMIGLENAKDSSGTLAEKKNKYTLAMLGGGSKGLFPIGKKALFAIDVDCMYTFRTYSAIVSESFWGSSSDFTTLEIVGIGSGLRVSYPSNGRVRLYGVAGGGLYFSKMQLPGTLLGIPGIYEEDKDTSFGYYTGCGLLLNLKKTSRYSPPWVFGLNYRFWQANASFAEFEIDKADIGGHFFGASVGIRMF